MYASSRFRAIREFDPGLVARGLGRRRLHLHPVQSRHSPFASPCETPSGLNIWCLGPTHALTIPDSRPRTSLFDTHLSQHPFLVDERGAFKFLYPHAQLEPRESPAATTAASGGDARHRRRARPHLQHGDVVDGPRPRSRTRRPRFRCDFMRAISPVGRCERRHRGFVYRKLTSPVASRREYPLRNLLLISPKISSILYSMVSGLTARCLKPCRKGKSWVST
jgi:hypothetical protein